MIPKNKSEADSSEVTFEAEEKENDYFMYKLPFTAFCHARNHVHGKHSDQLHS